MLGEKSFHLFIAFTTRGCCVCNTRSVAMQSWEGCRRNHGKDSFLCNLRTVTLFTDLSELINHFLASCQDYLHSFIYRIFRGNTGLSGYADIRLPDKGTLLCFGEKR
jgi:hypothetical protein